MLLKLDLQSEVPIYMQLKFRIIEGIATGALKPGESLPSVRQLAADLGINLHTVNKAYSILKQDGFIIIHRQKGVIVGPGDKPGTDEAYFLQLHETLKPIIAEAFCRGMTADKFTSVCIGIFDNIINHGGEI